MKRVLALLALLALASLARPAAAQLANCPGSQNALGEAGAPITSLPYTLGTQDMCLLRAINSPTPGTIFIPSIRSGAGPYPVSLWNQGTGTITLQPVPNDLGKTWLINGQASITLAQGQGADLALGDQAWYANTTSLPAGGGQAASFFNGTGINPFRVNDNALSYGLLFTSATTPANGGSGYAVGDVITLAAGTCSSSPTVAVRSVSGGLLTAFFVQNPGICSGPAAGPLQQSSTTGTGTGATFTVLWGTFSPTILSGNLASGAGNFAVGGSPLDSTLAGGSITTGTENAFVGYAAGARVTAGSFNVAMGHNALGIGGGCLITGGANTGIGTDSLRNFCGNSSVSAFGASALKNISNTSVNNLTALGANAMRNNMNSNGASNSTAVGTNACLGSGNDAAPAGNFRQANCFGANTGAALTSANHFMLLGPEVGNTTCATGVDFIIIGTEPQADCTSSAMSNTIKISAGTAGDVLTITGTNTPSTSAATVAGTLKISSGFTVATLPAAPPTGSRAYVTDATACTFMAAPTGGASTFCPVIFSGTAWLEG